jgi:U3 small nucleolar RNA-associated protein 10
MSRQLSLYSFLFAFFGNLKSIVTSYASYISESAAKILTNADLKEPLQRELWKRVLRTLAQSFEHDQDGFWQAPAHFSTVAPVLIEQFLRAGAVDVTEELVPAVVELAAAADSKEHHKELNGTLLKNLRSEQAAVRLAVIKCQQALTERLGEEWLASLPEMLPYISELQDDDDEVVERENRRWIVGIEGALGESLDSMLQ